MRFPGLTQDSVPSPRPLITPTLVSICGGSELGMEVSLDVLSGLWNTGLPYNFCSSRVPVSLGFCQSSTSGQEYTSHGPLSKVPPTSLIYQKRESDDTASLHFRWLINQQEAELSPAVKAPRGCGWLPEEHQGGHHLAWALRGAGQEQGSPQPGRRPGRVE